MECAKQRWRLGYGFSIGSCCEAEERQGVNPPPLHQNRCDKNPPLYPVMIHLRRCAGGKQVPHLGKSCMNTRHLGSTFPGGAMGDTREARAACSPFSPHPTMLTDGQLHSNTQPDAEHYMPALESIQSPWKKSHMYTHKHPAATNCSTPVKNHSQSQSCAITSDPDVMKTF